MIYWKNELFVKSGTGKPVHLMVPTVGHPGLAGERYSIDITFDMVEKEIAVPAPSEELVHGLAHQGLIEIVDAEKYRDKYLKYIGKAPKKEPVKKAPKKEEAEVKE
jgi:hypothetical protein